jgi:hypothetical protein
MDIRIVKRSDITACPKLSLSPAHYRDDGSCRCNEREACQEQVDRLWADLQEAREALRGARERLDRC